MTQLARFPTRDIALDKLHFAPSNPRLPENVQGKSEEELLKYIAEQYNAIEVANSIAQFGYFSSEPLIAIPEGEGFVVVEGNRRLAALRLLADPSLAKDLSEEKGWRTLARRALLPDSFPVVVVDSAEEVAPIIGYRHISGIQPWDPYAKARFIARLVEDGKSLDSVASLVGEKATDVAALYRNHEIVTQAKNEFKIDTSRVEKSFGVFTRALSSTSIRLFISAPSPRDVRPKSSTIPRSKSKNVKELFSWVFGDETNPPVIDESRDITQLGKVLESRHGLAVLRQTRDLEEAYYVAAGPLEALVKRLNSVKNQLQRAKLDLPEYYDDERIQTLLHEIAEIVESFAVVRAND